MIDHETSNIVNSVKKKMSACGICEPVALLTLFSLLQVHSVAAGTCTAAVNTLTHICDSLSGCHAVAGDVLTVPCGNTEPGLGVQFTYNVAGNSYDTHSFLILNITADHNLITVYCSSNVSTTVTHCYELQIEYPPLIDTTAVAPPAIPNNPYCLSCPVQANPMPSCSWTLCKYIAFRGCVDVSPSGVQYPESPYLTCGSLFGSVSLTEPVYEGSGCVIMIETFSIEFTSYQFSCTATNNISSATHFFGAIPAPVCGADSSELSIQPIQSEIEVELGDSVTLRCIASNAITSSFMQWKHNSTLLPRSSPQDIFNATLCRRTSVLELTNLTVSNTGNYTCIFYNGGASMTAEKTVFLDVISGPCDSMRGVSVRLYPLDNEINVTIGGSRNLTCSISNANTDSTIAWLHNGTSVSGDMVLYHSFTEATCTWESTLSLSNVRINQSGNYTCVLHNDKADTEVKESRRVNVLIGVSQGSRSLGTTIGSSLGIATFLILLTIVVAIGMVTYTIKKRALIWRPKEPGYKLKIGDKTVSYQYDVFLSFASDDEQLTNSILRQPLRDRGYTVCWHHDDFIPGKYIATNINDCILHSRKVIIVLSDNFFKSHYCKVELAVSLDKQKTTCTQCVVPILLKECNNLPSVIKDMTYLEVNTHHFFARLIQTIGKPIREVIKEDEAVPMQCHVK